MPTMRPEQLSSATLIFPATNRAARDYFEAAQRRGERVIVASSVQDAEAASVYGNVVHLPYIYDAGFAEHFLGLVEAQNIGRVYSPVASAYAFLAAFIAAQGLVLELVGASPIRQQVESYMALHARAKRAQTFVERCAEGRSSLSVLDIAAIYHQADCIYGESSDDKISTMIAIFADAPRGDVVEIGALMGKSTFVLTYLARYYGTGSVLAVDSWSADSAVQKDSPRMIQTTLVNEWDHEVLHEAFIINLLPIATRGFNYLHMESERAFGLYYEGGRIFTSHFGEVSYSGEIAVIHIDGNHDFRHVSKDCELWLSRLAPGGWAILDDYLWAHGDGPRRVGDTLLRERCEKIERAFVCGKALFLKFR